jgi:hypothetical protein
MPTPGEPFEHCGLRFEPSPQGTRWVSKDNRFALYREPGSGSWFVDARGPVYWVGESLERALAFIEREVHRGT